MLYIYKGVTYASEERVRQEIFNQERKAIPVLTTPEDWAKYGVSLEKPQAKPRSARAAALDEMRQLKDALASYDYIGVKIATGCATIEEYTKEIAECEAMRLRLNELRMVVTNEK